MTRDNKPLVQEGVLAPEGCSPQEWQFSGPLLSRARKALRLAREPELGLSPTTAARPLMAALASAASFAVGAALLMAVVAAVPALHLSLWVALSSLAFLAALGGVSAQIGGAGLARGIWRVSFWGALAAWQLGSLAEA